MTNPLHDAAMAAKRFHDAALVALDRPDDVAAQQYAANMAGEARMALEALSPVPRRNIYLPDALGPVVFSLGSFKK